jgi:hypothetical protein
MAGYDGLHYSRVLRSSNPVDKIHPPDPLPLGKEGGKEKRGFAPLRLPNTF